MAGNLRGAPLCFSLPVAFLVASWPVKAERRAIRVDPAPETADGTSGIRSCPVLDSEPRDLDEETRTVSRAFSEASLVAGSGSHSVVPTPGPITEIN